tara:strand:- start:1466 stop:2455 length:990 start_codon:yes stop_codon:yes gene_type:complete
MPDYFKNLGPISYKSIAKSIGTYSEEKSFIYKNVKFSNLKGLDNCSKNDLSFIYDNTNINSLDINSKGVIISKKNNNIANDKIIKFVVDDVHLALSKISNLFYREFTLNEKKFLKKTSLKGQKNISKSSVIKNDCLVGDNLNTGDGVVINEGCVIGHNVKIGSNTVIHNSIIGDNVEIESNCSIGQSGFGFAVSSPTNIRIFHIGRVIIQNNSYIGSGCTIDRGSFSDTYIGENVYLDNQVHIAHNVRIGCNTILAGQCGIAGSTIIGNNVRIGGQVGIIGHVNIGNNVEIAAKSGVRHSIGDNQKIMGDPAVNMFTHLKKTLKKNKAS